LWFWSSLSYSAMTWIKVVLFYPHLSLYKLRLYLKTSWTLKPKFLWSCWSWNLVDEIFCRNNLPNFFYDIPRFWKSRRLYLYFFINFYKKIILSEVLNHENLVVIFFPLRSTLNENQWLSTKYTRFPEVQFCWRAWIILI